MIEDLNTPPPPQFSVRTEILNLIDQISQTVIGQPELIRGIVTGLLCEGHVLIEGVPGLAKTTAVAVFAEAVDCNFSRLQFTPDLLPSDVIGSEIYRPQQNCFEVQRGPIFSNLILVDEINRAPAKVQSALLEAMQERQVSIGGNTLPLPTPFMVLATQNPIDQHGTYALPEAQLDRFLIKILVQYPDRTAEQEILRRWLQPTPATSTASPSVESHGRLAPVKIQQARAEIRQLNFSAELQGYVLDVVAATRNPTRFNARLGDFIRFGVSPRGSLALAQVARVHAYLQGRDYVTPDDIKDVSRTVLRHRLVLSYEALAEEMTADDVLTSLLDQVPVP